MLEHAPDAHPLTLPFVGTLHTRLLQATYDKTNDSFPVEYIVPACVLLALIFNYGYNPLEVCCVAPASNGSSTMSGP